jgi:DNA invertase Pin-like site-specific DNA recombinase
MAAVGYIRRSASGEAQASEQTQLEVVARLAAERGDTISHVYRDWGKSGGSETRPEYVAMLAQAEADGIHAIYCYD